MKPEKIGPYRVERKLGTGGMGEVYQAVDGRSGRSVAVKRISDPMAKKGRERERLQREARAAANLKHPSIVELVGLIENEAGHWLVMELVEGRSLTRILRDDGPLEVTAALGLFHQVAGALAEAHGQGILHRDLKTDNLMVTPGGRAKLLDFGLALMIQPDPDESRLTIDGRILGTPHAMSPEQARGWDLDHRSDLFSLGALLYESLSGTKPFLGKDPMESLRRVCFTRQKPLREIDRKIPRELAWLVDQLLAKEPRQRPQDTSEVARALERLLANGPVAEATREVSDGGEHEVPVRGSPRHLDLLHDRWRRAEKGEGQVVLLHGPANAGKSHRVAALQRGIRSRQMTWLACRCSSLEQQTEFAALLELLRRLLGSQGSEPQEQIEALEMLLGPHALTTGALPVVAEMLEIATSSLEPVAPRAREERERQVVETFLAWLQELAEARPTVVVFEELQWADSATLELLRHLIDRVRKVPMLLILTWQSGFRPPWGQLSQATYLTVDS